MNRVLHRADLGLVSFSGGGIAAYDSLQLVDEVRPATILSYVISGSVATEGVRAGQGEVMIHPPFRRFSEVASGAGCHAWLAFQFASFHPVWSRVRSGGVVSLGLESGYVGAFEDLLDAGGVSARAAAFFRMLSLVEGSLPETFLGEAGRFQGVCDWIRANIGGDVSRARLAERVGMHPNAFDRAFRLEVGQSSQEFVRSVRLVEVKHRLRTSSEPLEAIAFETGLATGAYLARWFKQETGLTPVEYRQSVKKTRTGYLEI